MGKWQRDVEKEALWRKRIEDWKTSPLNVVEFCKSRELNEHTFRSWQKVIQSRDAENRENAQRLRPGRRRPELADNAEKITFAPVAVVENRPEVFPNEVRFAEQRVGSIEVVTPRGYVVRLPMSIDVSTLQMVFAAINQSC